MAHQQYRLRLTEGTLLLVDHDALSTWLVDDKALVQPLGSQRWRLLKQFLADERAGIGSNYWEDAPVEYAGNSAEESRRRLRNHRALRKEKESVRGVVSGWVGAITGGARKKRSSAPERSVATPPRSAFTDMGPLVQALRKAEVPLDVPSTPAALPPDVLKEAPPLAVEPVPLELPEEPQEPEVVTVPDAEWPTAMAETASEPTAESPAVDGASADWTPQVEEEPRHVAGPAEALEPEPEIEITLNKLRPAVEAEAPTASAPAIFVSAPLAEPESVAASPEPEPELDLDVTINKRLPPELSERPKVRAEAPALDLEVTVNKQLPLAPVENEVITSRRENVAPPAPVAPIALEPEAPVEPLLSDEAEALRAAASAWLSPAESEGGDAWPEVPVPKHEPASLPRMTAPPALQVLADDPTAFEAPAQAGSSLRLKPVERTAEAPAPAVHDQPVQKVIWGSGPLGRFLCLVADWSEIIDGWIEKGKQVWERRGIRRRVSVADARRRKGHALPWFVGERAAAMRDLFGAWRGIIAGWIAGARAWRAARRRPPQMTLSEFLRDLPPPTTAPGRGSPPPARTGSPAVPISIEEDFDSSVPKPVAMPKVRPALPPPPIHALPKLRLAPIAPEPPEEEDVYDDGVGALDVVGLWVRRLVLTAALAAALAAALLWKTWMPAFKARGVAVATTLADRLEGERPSDAELEKRRQAQAFDAAAAQLPYLDRETIALVMSREGIVDADPVEIFHHAYGAVDRGQAALPSEAAKELSALRGSLVDALRSEERERVRDYDRTRRTRVTLPFEDRRVLEVLARAAATLTPESRARLQKLNAKAVAVALTRAR